MIDRKFLRQKKQIMLPKEAIRNRVVTKQHSLILGNIDTKRSFNDAENAYFSAQESLKENENSYLDDI